ncbi:MAG TPA: helix-turn-helix domain-containing protein [Pseudonocardiaceae bacterium]|nr:helix-turn-helix domain-containing protein [Pseudonocardiaceae bacterium]
MPGNYLRAWLQRYGMSQAHVCRKTGLSEKHLSAVITGKSGLTASVAVLIEDAIGLDAEALMMMQVRHDVAWERTCHYGWDQV